MRAVKQRILALILLACFSLLIVALFIITENYDVALWLKPLFLIAISGFCFGIAGSYLESRKLISAGLIIENQIMFIQAAKIEQISKGKLFSRGKHKSIDVFISCFGILLDTRVIPFNQNGIRLISIELSNDFISLSFQKNKTIFQTKVLHKWMDAKELAAIAEKFRYETGIVPEIQKQRGYPSNQDMEDQDV